MVKLGIVSTNLSQPDSMVKLGIPWTTPHHHLPGVQAHAQPRLGECSEPGGHETRAPESHQALLLGDAKETSVWEDFFSGRFIGHEFEHISGYTHTHIYIYICINICGIMIDG